MNMMHGSYGLFPARKITFKDPETGQAFESGGTAWATGGGDTSKKGVSASEWADLLTGIGAAGSGIGELVHGGRQAPGGYVAPTPTPTPAAPQGGIDGGTALLGVGALAMVGLLGLAVMAQGRRRY